MGVETSGAGSLMSDVVAAIPGIDEAASFGVILREIRTFDFDLVVFDTAPTGHTLRLLNFPSILEKGLLKMVQMREYLGSMLDQVGSMLGGASDGDTSWKKMFETVEALKVTIEEVSA